MNMNTLFKNLGLAATLGVLSACSRNYIPMGEYRIEWDEYDPRLHCQVVIFNESMMYDVFGPKDLSDWGKEFVEIGRFLQSARMDSMSSYKPEPIIETMLLKIKGSFWYRNHWPTRDLHGDTRYLLMVDENVTESLASFSSLTASNQPQLANLENDGRFRE